MAVKDRRPFTPLAQESWKRDLARALSVGVEGQDFEPRFIRYLVAMLDQHGFNHTAFALLRAAEDMAARKGQREEFDALVDLAIEVLSRDLPEHKASRKVM